jgi:hypothetical protein
MRREARKNRAGLSLPPRMFTAMLGNGKGSGSGEEQKTEK